jgi:hypothetical protein
MGIALVAIPKTAKPRMGITTTNIHARLPPVMNAATIAKINIKGERIAVLMIIINACCTFVTSVVILVIMLDEENLSIFSNEKSCDLV